MFRNFSVPAAAFDSEVRVQEATRERDPFGGAGTPTWETVSNTYCAVIPLNPTVYTTHGFEQREESHRLIFREEQRFSLRDIRFVIDGLVYLPKLSGWSPGLQAFTRVDVIQQPEEGIIPPDPVGS